MLDADSEKEEVDNRVRQGSVEHADIEVLSTKRENMLKMLDKPGLVEPQVDTGGRQGLGEHAGVEVFSTKSENVLQMSDEPRLAEAHASNFNDSSQTNATVGGEVSPASDSSAILPFEELMRRLSAESDVE